MDSNFSFSLPLDIVKAGTDTTDWRIGGYASTPTEDRQGDHIIQKGLDISDFVNHGWFNYDHDSKIILGYPIKSACKVDSKGFYVEGILLKDIDLAKTIWQTALALQKSGSPRRLGFSVEGKILERNSQNKIVKAKVYNIAITPNPINTDCTWSALVKSFATNTNDFNKALEAGNVTPNPLIPEDLEGAFKTLSYAIGDDEEAKLEMNKLRERLIHRQNISKSERVLYLQLVRGLSYKDAKSIVDKVKGDLPDE